MHARPAFHNAAMSSGIVAVDQEMRGPWAYPWLNAVPRRIEAPSSAPSSFALVAQSEEASDLKSLQCGFKSHRGYFLLVRVSKILVRASSPAAYRPWLSATYCHP